jgi:vacuolar-type H+-ATPase subunit H
MSRRRAPKKDGATAIVSNGELDFYKTLARPIPPVDYQTLKNQELRQRSKNRYTQWENTLEAGRRNKQKAVQSRRQQIETAQKLIDDQEQEFQDQQRKQCINRANRILYQGNDQVKELHSGLLLSAVMKERDQQVRLVSISLACIYIYIYICVFLTHSLTLSHTHTHTPRCH